MMIKKGLTISLLFFIALLMLAGSSFAKTQFSRRPDVKVFINSMVKKYGFKHADLNQLFDQVRIRNKVIQSMKHPFEAIAWQRYRKLFVSQKRITMGAKYWREHEALLRAAEKKYGVPPHIIVAILGVESFYGKHQGNYRVIDALSSLAFSYPRRKKFFTKELAQFLLLTREEDINPLSMKGSYAGAMGQPQFMPSSYRYYAVDGTGNHKRDLLNNDADIIYSIANYFKQHGWQAKQDIVAPAIVKNDKYTAINAAARKPKYRIKTLAKYDIRPKQPQPDGRLAGLIILNAKTRPEFWLGFNNFYVITRYNTSKLYAMAVYELAQEIAALKRQEEAA